LLLIAVVSALYLGASSKSIKNWAKGKQTAKDYILYNTDKINNHVAGSRQQDSLNPSEYQPAPENTLWLDKLMWFRGDNTNKEYIVYLSSELRNFAKAQEICTFIGAQLPTISPGDPLEAAEKLAIQNLLEPISTTVDNGVYLTDGRVISRKGAFTTPNRETYQVAQVMCERNVDPPPPPPALFLENLIWFSGEDTDKEYLVHLASETEDEPTSEGVCNFFGEKAGMPKLEKDVKIGLITMSNGAYVVEGEYALKQDKTVSLAGKLIGHCTCERDKRPNLPKRPELPVL